MRPCSRCGLIVDDDEEHALRGRSGALFLMPAVSPAGRTLCHACAQTELTGASRRDSDRREAR